jgi:hypothetical protein
MSEAMAMTNEIVSPAATNRIMRALISSFVILCLGTASTSDLCLCSDGFGGFVFDAFAVDSCTVGAGCEGDGEQANQGEAFHLCPVVV